VRYPLKDALGLDLVPHCALTALRSPVTLRRWYSNERTTSSLYYSGDTGTNRGTSLRRPFDAHRRAQIRSDVLRQAAEDLAAEEQAQVERHDPLYRDNGQEAPIPFSLTNEAHIIIGSQENQTPITIPPPGNSPALRHI
jgi:hypothetical protein